MLQQGACGGHFNTSSGVITSPLYPDNYPLSADCIYTITQPNGSYINLEVLSFDLYLDDACGDNVEIRDGSSEESPLIGKFCSIYITRHIQSSQNSLWLR